MSARFSIFLLVFSFFLTLAAPASAEVSSRESGVTHPSTEQGYAYNFEDDPLSAPGMGTLTGLIKVRPKVLRNTLIRPRLHFVVEMLKSVEAL